MSVLYSFIAVLGLALVAWLGTLAGLGYLFGVVIPYLAFAIFLGGFIYKVVGWAKSPVPFRIPTTCGQEQSLSFIKHDKLDCPSTKGQVVKRMLLEIFLFRSLFRNTRAEVHDGPYLVYGSAKWLWLFGLIFHYSFLVIVVRHLRLFTVQIPGFVQLIESGDGFMQLGAPVLYITNILFVAAITFLFLRRVVMPQVRYISLGADYFPLVLIFGIATTGIIMRYFIQVDVVAIKQLTAGWTTFSPVFSENISSFFFIHVFLVSTLLIYFPFSKLMHLGGVFMSPTRNMANNSRMVRHINPWNDPSIKPHSYAAYEDEFREFMVNADLPVEKELAPAEPEQPAQIEGEDAPKAAE
jgi:nitrate reductase gamma subunit